MKRTESSILIDSSGWISWLMGEKQARCLKKYFVSATHPIITPTLVLHEVYKVLSRKFSSGKGIFGVTQIENHSETIIELNAQLALFAADLGLKHKLATADSIIYATAQFHNATLITSDIHFKGLSGVTLV